MVGPIISGSMSLHVGWRSFWWFNTGLIALSFLMVLFMFPETKYERRHTDETIHQLKTTQTTEKGSQNGSDSEGRTQNGISHTEDTEKIGSHVAGSPTQDTENPLSLQATAERDPWLGKGSPSKQQWKLFQANAHPFKTILLDLWIPWKLFAFPIVEFSAFVVSWSCSSFLTINLIQSLAFAAPPYNFDSQVIGFFNFAILIGALLGLATAGPLSDWVSARATRKNRGIREPEMRLPAMSTFSVISKRADAC